MRRALLTQTICKTGWAARSSPCLSDIPRGDDVHPGPTHIMDHDIADPDRCADARAIDFPHTVKDPVLRDISPGLDRQTFPVAAGHDNRRSDRPLRMRHLPARVFVSDRAAVARHTSYRFSLEFHCNLAAHRAADTSQISRLHSFLHFCPAADAPGTGLIFLFPRRFGCVRRRPSLFALNLHSNCLQIRHRKELLLLQDNLLHLAGRHDLLLSVKNALIVQIDADESLLVDGSHAKADGQ